MKKLTVIGALILAVVVAFSAVGYAFAQTANPPAPQTTPQAWGVG